MQCAEFLFLLIFRIVASCDRLGLAESGVEAPCTRGADGVQLIREVMGLRPLDEAALSREIWGSKRDDQRLVLLKKASS
jgi:hypothetical protein